MELIEIGFWLLIAAIGLMILNIIYMVLAHIYKTWHTDYMLDQWQQD